jgi:phosphoribosylformimino-5-aminoimidazole carboxamide ribotide isomerase
MNIYPAIDIRGGQCVRLRQGDYAQETVFAADPAAAARRWVDQGASRLHIVDLDGAKAGRPVNGAGVRKIVQAAGVPCQLGGGLRTDADIVEALTWGVERVVIGTRALQDPAWLEAVCRRHAGKVVLGIDARDGRVATEGWLRTSDVPAVDLARRAAAWPLAALVYTDIGRDGMMQGPNLDALAEMKAAVTIPVIASGGITTADDIRRLTTLGLAGAIVGRALYEGKLNLGEILKIAGDQQPIASDQ